MNSRLSIVDRQICLDNKPFRILAGAMHYFRIHPKLWEDRLRKLKAMGLNTLETYSAWNVHETNPGEWNFTGFADIERYFQLAADLELKIIFRPGPYICSEWEFGGFPGWLANVPGIHLRCFNEPYLNCVRKYFHEICGRLRRFTGQGGPLIAVQVENEYGSYGNDKRYLQYLSNLLKAELPGVFQFTSDGPEQVMMEGGTLPELFSVGNFGSEPEKAFSFMEKIRPGQPKMCGEYWNGWFDHWGEKHHTRDPKDAAEHLRRLLASGGHVSIYMFHGGTNFGFMNGANHDTGSVYQPTVSSYDDDAPLNEHGGITEKYRLFREVLFEFGSGVDPASPLPAALPVQAYGKVALTHKAPLLENLERLSAMRQFAHTPCMEELGQNYGFILYRNRLSRTIEKELTVDRPLDRAQIFLNSKAAGTVANMDSSHTLPLTAQSGDILDILVENLGRVNYGAYLERDCRKGISNGIRTGNQFLFDWEVYPLPLENLSLLEYAPLESPEAEEAPCFYKGEFSVNSPADTFLSVPGRKGIAWINGFNLGRYWEIGPTRTLYIPAPLLRTGTNRIEILELHRLNSPDVELTDAPHL